MSSNNNFTITNNNFISGKVGLQIEDQINTNKKETLFIENKKEIKVDFSEISIKEIFEKILPFLDIKEDRSLLLGNKKLNLIVKEMRCYVFRSMLTILDKTLKNAINLKKIADSNFFYLNLRLKNFQELSPVMPRNQMKIYVDSTIKAMNAKLCDFSDKEVIYINDELKNSTDLSYKIFFSLDEIKMYRNPKLIFDKIKNYFEKNSKEYKKLVDMVADFISVGNLESASLIFNLFEEGYRGDFQMKIALALIKTGDYENARLTAELSDFPESDEIIVEIAKRLAREGMYNEAFALNCGINHFNKKVIYSIAEISLLAEKYDETIKAFHLLSENQYNFFGESEIFILEFFLNKGEYDRVFGAVNSIKSNIDFKDDALKYLSKLFFAKGKYEIAIQMMDLLTNLRDEGLSHLIVGLVNLDEFEEANKAANLIFEEHRKMHTLEAIQNNDYKKIGRIFSLAPERW